MSPGVVTKTCFFLVDSAPGPILRPDWRLTTRLRDIRF